ncbi:hypothetical protein CNY89_29400, partial [Amaricoccus sp. HAR-UPW-R2A-40]
EKLRFSPAKAGAVSTSSTPSASSKTSSASSARQHAGARVDREALRREAQVLAGEGGGGLDQLHALGLVEDLLRQLRPA